MALTRLNMIAKQWQGKADGAPGLKVHTRQRISLFLAKGQQTYTVGPASTDSRSSTTWGRTTLSASAAALATVLSIASTADIVTDPGNTVTMTNGDFIGIQQDDGTIFWSTISTTSGGNSVTLNAGITTTSGSGLYVWWFTSRAQRFPILEAAILRDKTNQDTPLFVYRTVESYEQGNPSKYDAGTPVALLVEPLRLNTRIKLDVQPSDVTNTIILTALYPAEDYDVTTNDIAFPQEWYRALYLELAFALSHNIGRWTPDLEKDRSDSLAWVHSLNPEVSNRYYQPDAP